MLGVLATIKGWITVIFQYGDLILLGAFLMAAGGVGRRWFSPPVLGFAGAVIMFLAINWHFVENDSDKVRRLDAEVRDHKVALAVSKAKTEEERKFASEWEAAAKDNQAALNNLRKQVEALNREQCATPGEFFDELDKLR